MNVNSVPIPTILKIGEVRKFNDLGGSYVGVLTEEHLAVYLRGNSSYNIGMPDDYELKEFEMFKKSHRENLMSTWRY